MKRPEDAVAGAAVALGRGLRDAGLATTVDAELVLCRALGELDLRRREHVRGAARAVFVHDPAEVPVFEAVFDRFWRGLAPALGEVRAEHGESDPRMPGPQHGGESLPEFRMEGRSSRLLDGQPTRATREVPSAADRADDASDPRRRRGLLAAYSPEEVLEDAEALRYADDELAAVRRLALELRREAPLRRTRRARTARSGGRLDLRRTLHRALRTDGELLHPARVAPSQAPRRLLVICDVSGSMERYSRALLGALEAVVGSGLKAEAFVFATRLTRLTGPLSGRDAAVALAGARAAVEDWSGGTRIGQALAELNATWARRGCARGAIVLVVSDGWDRGDPALLARELERLRLQSRRLIWIDPRPAVAGGRPLAVGLRAALPHVDHYVPGLDPAAMAALGRLLGSLGPGRPARRQRPLRVESGAS